MVLDVAVWSSIALVVVDGAIKVDAAVGAMAAEYV